MSKLSWCESPPPRYTRITDFARPFPSDPHAFVAPRRWPIDRPIGARAPMRRKSRRATPSQWSWIFRLIGTSNMATSMVEDEFLRVEQRPEQVPDHLGAVRPREQLRHRRRLRRAGTARHRGEEERLDQRRVVGRHQLRQPAVGRLDLLDHARAVLEVE